MTYRLPRQTKLKEVTTTRHVLEDMIKKKVIQTEIKGHEITSQKYMKVHTGKGKK